ncbi:glycosyltransferase N-terminal domain-containing protein [Hydrogenovibrio sp. 3SP14C1]|uniref:3-deoxy-D-manno-octulosonic acid transferase n=1 Tax=Hydrogenovibrio sp. 3SP14C1 TaxID=3038774 RepID=UPI002416954C|nr:glycosyltransferase N-terminal domain-containing protein [Hydrogenovibrio sp. 3SP14C1]MDG4811532.1 glycosyltransferase N-terminal domain-containing protein [Hydrogenovibrio sp. 3SP14C1]
MIYQSLIRLLSPLIILIIAIEAIKRKGGKRFFCQRLGIEFSKKTGQNVSSPIWIHCASIGEVKAAESLIRHLTSFEDILITTSTPTGATLVQELFSNSVSHSYLPFDWPYAIQNFLKTFTPKALWVVETEIWPNLYRLTQKKGIPISLINARLSQKTLNSPAWLKATYRKTLLSVNQILARSQLEADRFETLGAPVEKIHVLDNLKYAGLVDQPDYPPIIDREYVLAASTHHNEEQQLVSIWLKLNRPELLVIVPRHPKRRDQILKALSSNRQSIAVFSLNELVTDQTKIYIDDQIGALMPLYAHAKLVIMGGAFVSKGGHNVLEPAAVKATIITGSDMSDFEAETQLLLNKQAMIQLNSINELEHTIPALLNNDSKRQTMGLAAYQVIKSQSHILNDYLKALGFNES